MNLCHINTTLTRPTSQRQHQNVLREHRHLASVSAVTRVALMERGHQQTRIILWKDANSPAALERCRDRRCSNSHRGASSPVFVSFGRRVSAYFFVRFPSPDGEGRPAAPLEWERLELVVLGNSWRVKLTGDSHRTWKITRINLCGPLKWYSLIIWYYLPCRAWRLKLAGLYRPLDAPNILLHFLIG